MAQLTQYQPYGLPGKIRSFVAKTAGVTTALNYIGATGKVIGDYPPKHVIDSGDNLLVLEDIEAQGAGWFGGVSNYTHIQGDGDIVQAGTDRFLESSKYKLTPIGGFAISLTNKTGSASVAGQLVEVYSASAIDDAFKAAAANSDAVIGIVLNAGIADASDTWIIVSGIADVLMDGGGSARGDRIISSATAGSGDVWNVGGAVATHFLEIGHCIETRTGAGLARCVLHFN